MMLKVAAGKEWTRTAGEESLKVFSCRREQGPGRTLIRRAATADRWTSAEQSASSAAEQLGGGMTGRGGLWTEIIMISKAEWARVRSVKWLQVTVGEERLEKGGQNWVPGMTWRSMESMEQHGMAWRWL